RSVAGSLAREDYIGDHIRFLLSRFKFGWGQPSPASSSIATVANSRVRHADQTSGCQRQTLIPSNTLVSILKFSGIAWVLRGHLNNGPELDITMSALPPKADILQGGLHVRYVPIADIHSAQAIVQSLRSL